MNKNSNCIRAVAGAFYERSKCFIYVPIIPRQGGNSFRIGPEIGLQARPTTKVNVIGKLPKASKYNILSNFNKYSCTSSDKIVKLLTQQAVYRFSGTNYWQAVSLMVGIPVYTCFHQTLSPSVIAVSM